jgi:alpha-glucosidase (family GH31 glycosyl hydrolase)
MYLPQGEWRDAWEPENVYTGPGTVTVPCPFHKIPIFLKADSSLDLGDINALYRESIEIASNRPDLNALQKKEFSSRKAR